MTGRVKELLSLLLLLLLCCYSSVAAEETCPDSDEIRCSSQDKCVPLRYICDSDHDCDDGEDEDSDLCQAWRNDDCDKGRVKCHRNGGNTCVDIFTYCRSDDHSCSGDLDPRICQMVRDNKVQRLEDIVVTDIFSVDNLNRSLQLAQEFHLLMNYTMSHPQCPTMYTLVGDQCLSIFFVGSVTWGEARAFCQVTGGDLLTFRNISHYAAVASHLKHAQMTTDFWIGGRYVNETGAWMWVDDAPMDMGTPYWAVKYDPDCQTRELTFPELNKTRTANDDTCYNYQQAPSSYVSGKCVSLPYEHYFYVSDNNCLEKKSPLCVYTGDDLDFSQLVL